MDRSSWEAYWSGLIVRGGPFFVALRPSVGQSIPPATSTRPHCGSSDLDMLCSVCSFTNGSNRQGYRVETWGRCSKCSKDCGSGNRILPRLIACLRAEACLTCRELSDEKRKKGDELMLGVGGCLAEERRLRVLRWRWMDGCWRMSRGESRMSDRVAQSNAFLARQREKGARIFHWSRERATGSESSATRPAARHSNCQTVEQ